MEAREIIRERLEVWVKGPVVKIDHPKTRAGVVCPVCKTHKTVGLVVCWECYRRHNLRYGNPEIDAILDKWERSI
jgi:hypothetical protein